MKNDTLVNLIDLYSRYQNHINKIGEVLEIEEISESKIGSFVSDFAEIILDELGIPKDEDGYHGDYFYDLMFWFGDDERNKVTIEEIIELKNKNYL